MADLTIDAEFRLLRIGSLVVRLAAEYNTQWRHRARVSYGNAELAEISRP